MASVARPLMTSAAVARPLMASAVVAANICAFLDFVFCDVLESHVVLVVGSAHKIK